MWNNPYGAGPFMMAQQPPNQQFVYVPMPMGPQSAPQPTGKPGKRPITAKKLQKFHKMYEELMKSGGGDKKDEGKNKKLKDKTFSWFEIILIMIVSALPVSIAVLTMLKTATMLLRSLIL